MDEVETLVIGAGAAGLATAACLAKKGHPALVVDRAPAVGSSWRERYARLRLHTVKAYSTLPGLDFPAHVPRYPSRLDVVAYLEAYADAHGLEPDLGVQVRRVHRRGTRFEIDADGRSLGARRVVVATGLNRRPRAPRYPGQERFRGSIAHSAAYRLPDDFRGQRVLVVGFGNSGAEIALDLAEHEAEVLLAVRGGVNVMPRDFLGMPTQLTAIRLAFLPLAVRDRLGRAVARLAFGNLAAYGLTSHRHGPATQIARDHRIPVLDIGTLDAIRRGRLRVVPQVGEIRPDSVRFVDGQEAPVDAIILATGFEPGLDDFLAPELVPEGGYPPTVAAPTPGLYFVGFQNVASGLLREAGREGELVAAMIAGRARAGASPTLRDARRSDEPGRRRPQASDRDGPRPRPSA